MSQNDKKPPLLTGFSTSGAGKGKPLTSPTTSLWLAIIFVAILFAIGSVQRTVNRAEKETNRENLRFSPYLSEAPETVPEIQPPPNPDLILNQDLETQEITFESIELEQRTQPIVIKPIDVELHLEVPEELQAIGKRTATD